MTLNTGLDALIVSIDAILPQTQCKQCGYDGCKPYAAAIAANEAEINQCPPGGDLGIRALADLLAVEYRPLNIEHGVSKPKVLALIDETTCIGCTLCLAACPVDAILGAAKQMHTVITSECTGCELCLPPCPVDCISLEPAVEMPAMRIKQAADLARERYNFKLFRIEREILELAQKHVELAQTRKSLVKTSMVKTSTNVASGSNNLVPDKKAAIAAALARAKTTL
ncbi:MAG TPA: RnfABCDGE type electron transport complex subunit B [Methylotenera sp.]|nr:RnfABCDGE type electron transport complex subunit B [Methylotenera sp.]